jgi:hypothetical protein
MPGSIARIFVKRTSGVPEVTPEVGGSKVYTHINVKTLAEVPGKNFAGADSLRFVSATLRCGHDFAAREAIAWV